MSQAYQAAYAVEYGATALSTDERVFSGMYEYLTGALGLPHEFAMQRVKHEMENRIGEACVAECDASGIELAGKVLLDLGAGLGGVSLAASKRGATKSSKRSIEF